MNENIIAKIKETGLNIKMYRAKRGLTQAQLAEMCDMSIPKLKGIEEGNTSVRVYDLLLIAKALNVATIDLVEL